MSLYDHDVQMEEDYEEDEEIGQVRATGINAGHRAGPSCAAMSVVGVNNPPTAT